MTTSLFDKGLEVRKAVLGAEYVETSIKNADDFNRPLQELVTEYCWGAVWTREGLPRKTRSMLNLAMLATLNRPHELELHLRGALRNGVHQGRDPRSAAAGGDLRGRAGGSRFVPHRAQGVRRRRGQSQEVIGGSTEHGKHISASSVSATWARPWPGVCWTRLCADGLRYARGGAAAVRGDAARTRAGSPAALASAVETVLVSLPTPDIVRQVALGARRHRRRHQGQDVRRSVHHRSARCRRRSPQGWPRKASPQSIRR